jgi:four helix bundle protein
MTSAVQDFKQLRVWRRSMKLADACYEATGSFPDNDRFGLISQIRRSSVSVASNIAEGCGRDSHQEFARYLRTAYGSACELETQLMIAQRRKMVDEEVLSSLATIAGTTRRMLSGLIRSTIAFADDPTAKKPTSTRHPDGRENFPVRCPWWVPTGAAANGERITPTGLHSPLCSVLQHLPDVQDGKRKTGNVLPRIKGAPEGALYALVGLVDQRAGGE